VAFIDPLSFFCNARCAFKQVEGIHEAADASERSLHFAKRNGFPQNGAYQLLKALTGYTASIHHTLAVTAMQLLRFTCCKRHLQSSNWLRLHSHVSVFTPLLVPRAKKPDKFNNTKLLIQYPLFQQFSQVRLFIIR